MLPHKCLFTKLFKGLQLIFEGMYKGIQLLKYYVHRDGQMRPLATCNSLISDSPYYCIILVTIQHAIYVLRAELVFTN